MILGDNIEISSTKETRSKNLTLSPKARALLSSRSQEIETRFQAQLTLAGTKHKRNFIRNSCLRRATPDLPNPLTSKSIGTSAEYEIVTKKTTFITQKVSKISVISTTPIKENYKTNIVHERASLSVISR